MDAVNGNATVNVHDFERCCSGIANIHEETFEQRRKTKMQTIEEYKAYTKQLEGEVGKWHNAYEALVIERNQLVSRIKELERQLKKEG